MSVAFDQGLLEDSAIRLIPDIFENPDGILIYLEVAEVHPAVKSPLGRANPGQYRLHMRPDQTQRKVLSSTL